MKVTNQLLVTSRPPSTPDLDLDGVCVCVGGGISHCEHQGSSPLQPDDRATLPSVF